MGAKNDLGVRYRSMVYFKLNSVQMSTKMINLEALARQEAMQLLGDLRDKDTGAWPVTLE
jgi:hypothetical protein